MPSDITFTNIVCGIDGSPAALEGARHAAALAGADASVELVAVVNDPFDVDRRAGINDRTAAAALATAADELAAMGTYVVARKVVSEGRFVWDKLLDVSQDADLLVVGRHRRVPLPPPSGGQTITNILQRAELPVLVATATPAGRSFPGRILVAAAGPGHPENAVRIATALAGRTGSDDVVLVRAGRRNAVVAPAVAAAAADLREVAGAPTEVVTEGLAPLAIVEWAARERASLVITGARRKTPLSQLRSVSTRVAHAAPCSVLVMPITRTL
jgi:nucleotide-binding universal stress UspA family protein